MNTASRRHIIAFLLAGFGISTSAFAQSETTTATIDRIEEDWELNINTPDVDGAGPQITTVMCTTGDRRGDFVVFNLNYREFPNFRAGGLQLQVWEGNNLLGYHSHAVSQCATNNESIRWTQSLKLLDGEIQYRITSGTSTTWGNFGPEQAMTARYDTSATSLDEYTPESSITNSGVGWQADHVRRMVLKRVRYYAGSDLVSTDDTERSVSGLATTSSTTEDPAEETDDDEPAPAAEGETPTATASAATGSVGFFLKYREIAMLPNRHARIVKKSSI